MLTRAWAVSQPAIPAVASLVNVSWARSAIRTATNVSVRNSPRTTIVPASPNSSPMTA